MSKQGDDEDQPLTDVERLKLAMEYPEQLDNIDEALGKTRGVDN